MIFLLQAGVLSLPFVSVCIAFRSIVTISLVHKVWIFTERMCEIGITCPYVTCHQTSHELSHIAGVDFV